MKTKVTPLEKALVRLHLELEGITEKVERRPLSDRAEKLQRAYQLVNVDEVSRKALDQSCRQWIKTNKWPLPENQEQAVLIWERVKHAYQLGIVLAASGFESRKTVAQILRFLLIDGWNLIGSERMKADVYKFEHAR